MPLLIISQNFHSKQCEHFFVLSSIFFTLAQAMKAISHFLKRASCEFTIFPPPKKNKMHLIFLKSISVLHSVEPKTHQICSQKWLFRVIDYQAIPLLTSISIFTRIQFDGILLSSVWIVMNKFKSKEEFRRLVIQHLDNYDYWIIIPELNGLLKTHNDPRGFS